VSGEKVKPSKLNGYFSAIYSKFLGGIVSADLAPAAGIVGTQISTAFGSRITKDNLEDGAVVQGKLKQDTQTGRPNAAVTRNAIVDGIIDSSAIAASAVSKSNLNVSIYTATMSSFFTPNTQIIAGGFLGPVLLGVSNFGSAWDATLKFPLHLWHEGDPALSSPGAGPLRLFYVTGGTNGYICLHNPSGWTIQLASQSLKLFYIQ
jgi:hypothetical protein